MSTPEKLKLGVLGCGEEADAAPLCLGVAVADGISHRKLGGDGCD